MMSRKSQSRLRKYPDILLHEMIDSELSRASQLPYRQNIVLAMFGDFLTYNSRWNTSAAFVFDWQRDVEDLGVDHVLSCCQNVPFASNRTQNLLLWTALPFFKGILAIPSSFSIFVFLSFVNPTSRYPNISYPPPHPLLVYPITRCGLHFGYRGLA